MTKDDAIKIMNAILDDLGMTPYELSKHLGMKRPQGLYDVMNPQKENVGISKNLSEKIISVFPKFNKSWILTGEGYMLKQGTIIQGDHNTHVSGSVSGDRNHIGVHNDGRVLQELQSENRRLTELNHKLVNDNMKLVERINFLTDKLLKS